MNLELVVYPNPFLLKVAKEITITEIAMGKIQNGMGIVELAETMKIGMLDLGGVGLAATQVGIDARLFVAQFEEHQPPIAILNPILSNLRGSQESHEGCLSFPQIGATVKRPKSLTLSGLDPTGNALKLDLEGFGACVAAHEMDHLNGIIFVNKVGLAARRGLKHALEGLERDFAFDVKNKPPEVRNRLLRAAGLI